MKSIIIIILVLPIFKTSSQSLSSNPNYDSVWSEEFSGNSLNTARWTVSNDAISNPNVFGVYNSNQNVNISDGVLHLSTTWTSPLLKTSSIQCEIPQIQGGFYEVKAKFKNGPQAGPTAWLWNGNGACEYNSNGNYQEIDILEYYGSVALTTGAVHYCTCTCAQNDVPCLEDHKCRLPYNINKAPFKDLASISYALTTPDDWHLYGTSWRQSTIGIYQDWQLKSSRNTPSQMMTNNSIKYFVLGMAARCDTTTSCQSDYANYPYTEDVDYVRIFTLKTNCTSVVDTITDYNTFNYSLKKSFSLSNSTITKTSGRIVLLATDFIEFKNGVEIINGQDFEMGIMPCQ